MLCEILPGPLCQAQVHGQRARNSDRSCCHPGCKARVPQSVLISLQVHMNRPWCSEECDSLPGQSLWAVVWSMTQAMFTRLDKKPRSVEHTPGHPECSTRRCTLHCTNRSCPFHSRQGSGNPEIRPSVLRLSFWESHWRRLPYTNAGPVGYGGREATFLVVSDSTSVSPIAPQWALHLLLPAPILPGGEGGGGEGGGRGSPGGVGLCGGCLRRGGVSGAQRVETPKGECPQGWFPEGWGPKFRALFLLSRHIFLSFFSFGVFSWNFGVLKRALKCPRLEFSSCREAPAAFKGHRDSEI